MAKLKFKIKKAGLNHPRTKQRGFIARVLTNGTADYEEIAADAGENTTMHKAEIKLAFELCIESVAKKLKQGYIIDLGPVGKLYPSCSSSWVATAKELHLEDVKPSLNYRPSEEIAAAVRGAQLQWDKVYEDEEGKEG